MKTSTTKKIKVVFATISVLLLPVMALAQMTPPTGVNSGVTLGQNFGLSDLVTKIENAMATVFGAIAVIMFLIAGILFLTAGGAPEKVQAARSAFMWGIAGVVVGIIAFSIVTIVGSFLK